MLNTYLNVKNANSAVTKTNLGLESAKFLTEKNPTTLIAGEYQPNDFSEAIYNGGPYSLMRPNATTNLVAQNIDLIA